MDLGIKINFKTVGSGPTASNIFAAAQKSHKKRRKLSTQFNHERNCILNLSIASLRELGRTFSKKLGGFNEQVQKRFFMCRTNKT